MRALLVLWDVDHTLIENNGVNKETYALAFRILTGRAAEHRARTEGRTEPEIMRNMLIEHGIDPHPHLPERISEALTSATQKKVDTLRERGHRLPGARAALSALAATPNVHQSVLTGNLRPNALTKLSTFALDDLIDFEVGGYGSDSDVRYELVAAARSRASDKYGVEFDTSTTVLIGDTPRDVLAGQKAGARVIAVASGSDSVAVLEAAGADATLPDLRDTRALTDAVKRFGS